MHLSYLPDEMNIDFETSLRLGAGWGLHHADIRTVDGVNVLDLTDAQIERAKELLNRYGMRVTAIATPFFKCTLPGQVEEGQGAMHSARTLTYADHVALLPRAVAIAQAFGAPYLRIFSFWRQPGVDFWPALDEAVEATLNATAGSGITPCLENEGACFIGTSAELAAAARRYRDPRFQFIWDPGNSTHCGMTPRAGDFAVFADRIAQVHLKDGHYNPTTGKSVATAVGAGDTGYHTELRRLQTTSYNGALTLEPHYCPEGNCVEGMRQSIDAIRRIAAEVGVAVR